MLGATGASLQGLPESGTVMGRISRLCEEEACVQEFVLFLSWCSMFNLVDQVTKLYSTTLVSSGKHYFEGFL